MSEVNKYKPPTSMQKIEIKILIFFSYQILYVYLFYFFSFLILCSTAYTIFYISYFFCLFLFFESWNFFIYYETVKDQVNL